ncbi:VanZ family protein [Actinoplanes sp. NPDC051470]|uniref:VanZ family protein n=1 Tax=unclassified Actinoplanes TaxID=2626549 RepID=UPI003442D47D
MISTFLVEHRWLPAVALVLLFLVGPLMGSWLVTRPRTAWVMTGVTLLPLAFLTLLPENRQLFARCQVQWEIPPLTGPESMANILLFVAPVLLAGVATRRPVLVMVAGSGLSAMVEAFQAAVPALGRSCDSDDWVHNTIGAVLGTLLAVLSLALAPYWSRRARSSSVEIHD